MPRIRNRHVRQGAIDIPLAGTGCFPLFSAAPPPLSARLRAETATLHRDTEALLGLPGSIQTRNGYIAWLGRFLGLYEPLERSLATFGEWDAVNIAPPWPGHGANLTADLRDLGADPGACQRAPLTLLPRLPTFAHALGVRYVLEGSALGGRLIAQDVEARIGAEIANATRFFGGRGKAASSTWQHFRAALDRFGCEHPSLQVEVTTGAERAFVAILAWFAPFQAGLA
jgi:heme oxygenase